MEFLTDFADQAVALPASVAIAAILLARGGWRGALAWLAVVACSFGLVLLLKLGLVACGPLLPGARFQSPSGHTMSGPVVYGGLLMVLGLGFWPSLAAAAAIAVAIGWSRVALGAHTLPEVLVGGLIGVAAVAAFGLLSPRGRPALPAGRHRGMAAVCLLALVLLLHGQRLRAEPVIQEVAQSYIRAILGCGRTSGPNLAG